MKLSLPASGDVPLDTELVARVGWFIQLRWLVGVAVLAGATISALAGVPAPALYPVGAAILTYNLLLSRMNRRLSTQPQTRPETWRLFAHLQIALDWIALSALTAITGGLESPLLLLYTIHVILAAMLLPRRECLVQTTTGFLLIAAMAYGGLSYSPAWPTRSPFAAVRVYGDNGHVLIYLVSVAGMLYLCALLASSVAERLRIRERELVNARNREARMHAEMALLHELAKSITETLDLDQVLQRVVEQAAAVTQARACSIRVLTASGELPIVAADGLSDAYLQKGQVDLARSPVDRKAMLGEVVFVDDVEGAGLFQYPEELQREGIRSLVCVPLMAHDRPQGVMRVYASQPKAFDEADVRFLQHFASLASIAIRNARTLRALQEADRERSRFVRTVAHELRSPLAAILGNLRLILQGYAGAIPERARTLLERAHHRGDLLLALAGDLLALVAGRDPAAQAVAEPVSLADVVRQASADLAPQARARSIDLEVDAPEGPPDLHGNRHQLLRLVDNLVSNAIKYTPDGGHVAVRVRTDARSVQLVVEDTGIGIPRDAQARLFQEFFRAENARQLTDQGTGLGLAIVKRIAESHRATISLESQEGRGTRVTVVFPRDERPSDAANGSGNGQPDCALLPS